MNEYLTIAEYAKIRGISTTAVYKRLKTSLQPFTTVVNGKICLLSTVLEFEKKESCQPVINPLTTVDNPVAGSIEATIETLREQLKEKDKQIERLQEETAELRRAGADKDKFIQEQATRLSVLLEQSQELQRNNQILLGYTASKTQDEETPEPIEPEKPTETDKGLIKKFFNIFKKH